MAIAEAAAVVSTLRNASDLLNQLRKSDDKESLRSGISALTEMLIDARTSALTLLEEKAELIDRIRQLEQQLSASADFGDDSEKYERFKTAGGKYVYRERSPAAGVAGTPYFCPTCFGAKKASVLQGGGEFNYHNCHVCGWSGYL